MQQSLDILESLEKEIGVENPSRPFVLNNLGMVNYFKFIDDSSQLKDPMNDMESV